MRKQPLWHIVICLIILGEFLVFTEAMGQIYTGIVKRNVNLRPDPSSNNPPIRLLRPPEEIRVLTPQRVNRYYNVITGADEEGWVWSANVEVDEVEYKAAVKRNVNLRNDPSSANPPIRLLTPPMELTVLDLAPSNRYYRVETPQGEQGWVWGNNIEITESGPPTAPPPDKPDFQDAHDAPIAGWTGPVFELSHDYPATQPSAATQPWKQFDFRTQAAQYLQSVLAYAMEGNVDIDWQGQNNTVRKWYHTPWLHAGNNGREFVHGLTRERSSRPRELHPNQSTTFPNWAVGLYNPLGGYTIGQVWQNPDNPNPSAAIFPEGAVAIKLLFTTATIAEVPYLQNALVWEAHISRTGTSSTRTIQQVRLLQIDIAVRDTRADNTTGWVFGTFSYDGNAPGATVWERMIPIGLMWGNDPNLTPTAYASGDRPAESVIINRVVGVEQHLGWLERLNGPVDNPRSSCLSCHSTAQHEPPARVLPRASDPDDVKMRWFRNIKTGEPFDTGSGQVSLDYSLQLSEGLENFYSSRRPSTR